jgi:hypothetical protein
MEERERDERVEGVGEELLLGEREVGGLEVVGGDHGCARLWSAQEEETMAMAGRREDRGRSQEGDRGGQARCRRRDGNVFFFHFYLFPFSLSKDEATVTHSTFLNWF